MKKNQVELSIIIVTYNSQFWLDKTLSSLHDHYLLQTQKKVAVVVVDNHSQDDSIKLVEKQYPWAKLIKLDENRGFAVANNLAIQAQPAKHYLLLNSDTELTSASNLDVLLNFLARQKKVGIITPRLEFSDGKLDPACHRGEPTPQASLFYFLGLEKLFPRSKFFGQYHQTFKDLTTIHTVDACSGASLLIKDSVYQTIGGLDERFFMYAEDLDWCKRAREAGYLVVYHPGVTIIHHKHKSGIKNTSQKIAKKTRAYFFDTMLQYYDKHYAQEYPKILRQCLYIFINLMKGGL